MIIKEYKTTEKQRLNSKKWSLSHSGYWKDRDKKYRDAWLKIITDRGMNKCSRCGYDKCFRAIDFHHVNPIDKKHEIGILTYYKPTAERIKELDKCISLCANCHREEHCK